MEKGLSSQVVMKPMLPYQLAALHNPFQHFVFFAGVASGKTFTGSHFAINNLLSHPDKTGLVGANDYTQLSTATLREFFFG
jgi:hypothetical protein